MGQVGRKRSGVRRRLESGFTLVEMLVAMTVLAVAIVVMTRAFLTALSVTATGGNLTVATALATQKLEEIRANVEAQPDRVSRREAFCAISAQPADGTSPLAFPPPHDAYTYRVRINSDAVRAEDGADGVALPVWSIERVEGISPWSEAERYAPDCRSSGEAGDDDRLRWVAVEVFFRGGSRPLVRMVTAVIRGADGDAQGR